MENQVAQQSTQENKFQFPSEIIELPSKGLVYPEDNPLSSGKIEMKYMTAKEEDILTNQNYIRQGIVIDKLLRSLIISKINFDDLIIGDKNAVLMAARVLGYGKDYEFSYDGNKHTVDLSTLENKEIDESSFENGKNLFDFTLPFSKTDITYKILTHGDEVQIEREIAGYKKIDKNSSKEVTTRMKYVIQSVNGDSEKKSIRNFIDTYLLAKDSKALRKHIKDTQPDVDTSFEYTDNFGIPMIAELPITPNFFWPD